MARDSKPYYRAVQKRWVSQINGKRVTLGITKKEAFQKFHELMADQEKLPTEGFTLYDLSQVYLDWVQTNRKETTYKLHLHFLKSFLSHVGRKLKPSQLKPSTVSAWSSSGDLNTTSQAGAIAVVQRLLNWAVEHEHLKTNPIAGLKKPRQKRRDVVYTPDQWKEIRNHVTDGFGDLLDFLYYTGCRPQEARILEARHIHGDVVIFPADESKGEQGRVLYLTDNAKKIVERLTKSGVLFLNSRGIPWTKDSIKCRLTRISKKVGFRVVAYGIRHSYCTNALMNGVDPISLARLMGHQSTKMIDTVYSHLTANPDYLRAQANKAV